MPKTPRLFVISGPSGAGKGTLLAKVRESYPNLDLTVSATTRAPRAGEKDGISYHFLTEEQFDEHVAAGDFLEWAWVHDHRYGTLKSEVEGRLAAGHSTVLEIDVQGALHVREVYPEAVLIFIEPPSLEVLEARLRIRGTEDEKSLATRLSNATCEMAQEESYDARIINDDLSVATQELLRTLQSYEK